MANQPASDWEDLSVILDAHSVLPKLNDLLKTDAQFVAFCNTPALAAGITFQVVSAPTSQPLTITASNAGGAASFDATEHANFILSAQPSQWQAFFSSTPTPPFHAYWGIRLANAIAGIECVSGNLDDFARFAHIWRCSLELLRHAICGPVQLDAEPEADEAHVEDINGRYVHITVPDWGRCQVFYEKSGSGPTPLVLIHSAGSDARQMCALLAAPALRVRCSIYALDLPGHGRSLLGSSTVPGAYRASEDAFVDTLGAFIRALRLDRPILCGPSMAGNICLAAAIRNSEVHAGAVVALEACEHIPAPRWAWDRSPFINAALFCPESVYATMSPSTPLHNKQLMWQTYSGQAYGVLAADLDWYFGGWDGRGRVESIDTKTCPVFMFTGEHDFVNPPALSQATAAKIPGSFFEVMSGLGHFPVAEKPSAFLPFLLKAIAHYEGMRKALTMTSRV